MVVPKYLVSGLPSVLRVVRRTASSHSVSYSYMARVALAPAALALVSLLAAINFDQCPPVLPNSQGFPAGRQRRFTQDVSDPREHSKVYSYYRGRCRTLQYRIVLICRRKGPDFVSSDTTKPRYCPTRPRGCLAESEPTQGSEQ
uniref:Uncharacterized protein n=1 Tax=Pleurozia purpurea TaxID=280637 RepID=D0R028_9MARC|nr:hypothetical protein PlpuMp29 [Pleurozia purpurea]ACR19365.1 hypothetical protein PlpuMp29 [Pleurozia purpurea]